MADVNKMPLSDLRVVEFCHAIAGPAASMLLADFGAEVLKVEPLDGDNARKWGSARWGENNEFSAQYLALNRNKFSIALDLKTSAGRDAAIRIIKSSDVVIENYKPGVMDRLGLGYEAMSKQHPQLVFCSVSGFGQTGPLASRPGYDQLMQAYTGMLSLTGEPNRTAVRIGPSAIDILASSYAVNGILMALRSRDQTGKGQYVDVSLYESALQTISHFLVDCTGTGASMGRQGPYLNFLAPYGNFKSSDREFFFGVGNQAMWLRFCDAIGRNDLTQDPRFHTNADRTRNMRALYDILEPLFMEKPASHWMSVAESLDIPHSLIYELEEVVTQEQAIAREATVAIGELPKVRSAGIPIKLSDTPGSVRKAPPSLGSDAVEMLGKIGFTSKEIEVLKSTGVLL